MKNSSSKENESVLIKQLIAGDRSAFSKLFYSHSSLVLYVARQYIQDEEEAREIVQETFYQVWKYRENMKSHLSFKAYVVTISKRLIFNRAKKKMHELAYQEYYIQQNTGLTENLEDLLNFRELDQKITRGIESLPPKRKEIFILSREKGLSNREIADQLNISVSTVENQMNKSLKYLRELIASLLFIFFC